MMLNCGAQAVSVCGVKLCTGLCERRVRTEPSRTTISQVLVTINQFQPTLVCSLCSRIFWKRFYSLFISQGLSVSPFLSILPPLMPEILQDRITWTWVRKLRCFKLSLHMSTWLCGCDIMQRMKRGNTCFSWAVWLEQADYAASAGGDELLFGVMCK